MKATVLLPTVNRADVLGFAIESVLGQTVSDFELFIVLDGCTDGSLDVVKEFAARDARVRWWDLPKGFGSGMANRNVALREARGEFIAYMQHDDIWFLDHLEKLLAPMSDPRVVVTTGRTVWVSRRGRMTPGIDNLHDAVQREHFMNGAYFRLPSHCWAHRRSAFEQIGYWPEIEWGGDLEMERRLMRISEEGGYFGVPEETSLHFEKPNTAASEGQFWNVLHRAPGRLDDALRLDVPEGKPAQEAAWNRLRSRPSWVQEIRHACARALEICAFDLEHADVPALRRTIERLQEKISRSRDKQEMHKQKAGKLREKLEALRAEQKKSLAGKIYVLWKSFRKRWRN